jgi:hypothetical protein
VLFSYELHKYCVPVTVVVVVDTTSDVDRGAYGLSADADNGITLGVLWTVVAIGLGSYGPGCDRFEPSIGATETHGRHIVGMTYLMAIHMIA